MKEYREFELPASDRNPLRKKVICGTCGYARVIVFIRFDDFLHIPLRCSADENPFGVLASDSSVIYATTSVDGYDNVTLKSFEDESEYIRLKEELASANTPEYIEPETTSEEVDPSVLDTTPITAEEALNITMGVYE